MAHEYEVKRKMQEQSGSYFVILPKIWVEAMGIKQSDPVSVTFNGEVKIRAIKVEEKVGYVAKMPESGV
jgi:antitoxin component of MazEF toxin-antitoxin module